MKREGQQGTSERGTRRSRQRRRRGLKKILLGSPSEVTADYPGFFVLPRASSAAHTSPGKHPTRRAWWSRIKFTVALLLVLGGFVGVLAYFFARVAPLAAEPHPESNTMSSDAAQQTNSNLGTFW